MDSSHDKQLRLLNKKSLIFPTDFETNMIVRKFILHGSNLAGLIDGAMAHAICS